LTNGPTALSLVPSAASVFASLLGPLRIVRCVFLLHTVRIHCLRSTVAQLAAVAFVRFIHYAFTIAPLCFGLINYGQQFN
jgi:hypothetical protein